MNPESNPIEVFPPLPVRSRGILEMLDTSIKLYKQYVLVLLGWSAAANVVIGLYNHFGLGPDYFWLNIMIALGISALATTLSLGAAVCCIAAAVRGQRVTFPQCWQFTKPRYWPLVGISLLSKFVLLIVAVGVGLIWLIGIGLVAAAFGAMGSGGSGANIFGGILAIPLVIIAIAIPVMFGLIAFIWQGMVSIVICMEDHNRNANAMGRAFDLLRQNWMRVAGLMFMFGLLLLILFGFMAFTLYITNSLPAFKDLVEGKSANSEFFKNNLIFGAAFVALSIVWEPWEYLILSLLYLDIRVRKEALDLEWSAHQTAPQIDSATLAAHGFDGAVDLVQGGQPGVAAFSGNETHVWGARPGFPAPTGDVPSGYGPPPDYAPDPSLAPAASSLVPHPSSLSVNIVRCQLCGTENSGAPEFCAACGARMRPAG